LKSHLANFRCYEQLNDFLAGDHYQQTIAYRFGGGQGNTESRASRRMLFDFIENRLIGYLQNEQATGHDRHIGLEET